MYAIRSYYELINAMRKGEQATLTFASIEAKAFNIPVSLTSATKAEESCQTLCQKMRATHGWCIHIRSARNNFV